jgi:hypothetical protein
VKISDLLPKKFHQSQEPCTLYLLYEIKRGALEEDEEGSDSEEGEEDEAEGSEEGESENEEALSQRDRSSQKGAKGPAKDEEEQDLVDVFTDLLGLIFLNKHQREAEGQVALA